MSWTSTVLTVIIVCEFQVSGRISVHSVPRGLARQVTGPSTVGCTPANDLTPVTLAVNGLHSPGIWRFTGDTIPVRSHFCATSACMRSAHPASWRFTRVVIGVRHVTPPSRLHLCWMQLPADKSVLIKILSTSATLLKSTVSVLWLIIGLDCVTEWTSVNHWEPSSQRQLCLCSLEKVNNMLNDVALGVDTSELRDVTCHMGSHSVTCHQTQVNTPCLTPARKAGTRLTYPGGMEGWVALGFWLHTEMVYPSTDGHPSKY